MEILRDSIEEMKVGKGIAAEDVLAEMRQILVEKQVQQMEILRASVAEMKAGKGIAAEDVLAEMRQILVEKQAQ